MEWGKSPGDAGDTVAPSCRDSLVMGATLWRIVALWSALGDHVADGIVEIRLLDELLQGDVHTVTPVVLWICWDIDALLTCVCETDILVCGEPILKGEDAEHGWAIEVIAHNVGCNIAAERMWRIAVTTERTVPILLSAIPIFIPPHTESGGIMAGNGADREKWIIIEHAECYLRILWHGLYLK